jgi:transketolase
MRQEALNHVLNLAQRDSRVVFVGSDLGAGTLAAMQQEFPTRFFMEGIAEQYMVGFSAGLAKEGFIPYLNTIGTFFTRRSFEQLSIDVGLHKLPVRILASGGGMVYAPLGPTHTAIEDLALMLSIPGMKVFSPADAEEMVAVLEYSLTDSSPMYIRFGKGGEKVVTKEMNQTVTLPKVFGNKSCEILICTTGVVLQHALDAKDLLGKNGFKVTVAHFPFLNDLGIDSLKPILDQNPKIFVAEEHVPVGGLFTQFLHQFHKLGIDSTGLIQLSLLNEFSHKYGSQIDHLRKNNLTGETMSKFILELHK